LIWFFLEMICNAVRHTAGEEIAVTLTPSGQMPMGNKAREHGFAAPTHAVLRVSSEGTLDMERLQTAVRRTGAGVQALLHSVWLHRGSLLWMGRDGMATACLRLPIREGVVKTDPLTDTQSFTQDLLNRMSPYYTALAPVLT
jgi:hypothetical protein